MIISPFPVGVADPPASSSAAPASRGGPSFGRYVDDADAQAGGKAAARARQPASSDARRGNQPGQSSSSHAPAAADRPSGKGSGKSNSSGRATSPESGGQQQTGDNASQRADGLVVPPPVALPPVLPPIAGPIGILPPANSRPTGAGKGQLGGVQAVIADAGASSLSPLAAARPAGQVGWQAAVAAANATADGAAGAASAPAAGHAVP